MYAIALSVFCTHSEIDFSTFHDANIFTFLIGDTSVMLIIAIMAPIIIQFVFSDTSNLVYWATSAIISATWARIMELSNDILKFIHLDFGVSATDSAINWAITTDIAYSLYFILPSFFLVLAQRWSFGRRILLNFISIMEGHSKGVLYAIGELLMKLFTALGRLFEKNDDQQV